jgi:hypothetical protein
MSFIINPYRFTSVSSWVPTDDPFVIHWNNPDTMFDSGGALADVGEVVETWGAVGSVGDLTMTRSSGSPIVATSNGQRYLALPNLASDGAVYSFTTKDLVGTELWVVLRKTLASTIVNMLSDSTTGTFYQFKAGANMTVQGSNVAYTPTPLVPLSQTDWVIGRARFTSSGGFLEIDSAGRDTFTGAQSVFQVGVMGRRVGAERSTFDIAHAVTLFGTATTEQETNLYTYLGAQRDALNGV